MRGSGDEHTSGVTHRIRSTGQEVAHMDGLEDETRSGRPRCIDDDAVAEVIRKTLEETPRDATHCTRSMARATGYAPSTIHRMWQASLAPPQRDLRYFVDARRPAGFFGAFRSTADARPATRTRPRPRRQAVCTRRPGSGFRPPHRHGRTTRPTRRRRSATSVSGADRPFHAEPLLHGGYGGAYRGVVRRRLAVARNCYKYSIARL